jgi:hypothetical protein
MMCEVSILGLTDLVDEHEVVSAGSFPPGE